MQVHVDNAPEAVGQARQALADTLAAWGFAGAPAGDAVVGDLLLIATELLSNAVKFSSGEVSLALTWTGGSIRVTATDTAPAPAALADPGPDASGGRGLAIVAALAQRWGQTPFRGGRKEVWAEVAVPHRPGARGPRGATTTATAAEG